MELGKLPFFIFLDNGQIFLVK